VAAFVEEQQAQLLDNLLSGDQDSATVSVPGAVITAARLDPAKIPEGASLAVPVEGSKAEVAISASLFAQPGVPEDAVLIIKAFDDPAVLPAEMQEAATSDEEGAKSEVKAVIDINIAAASAPQDAVKVEGLPDPIKITIPVNASADIMCAYWIEETQEWSSEGLETILGDPNAPVVCATTHLTVFAAIARGVIKTLDCSQATLLTEEGVSALWTNRWATRIDALLLWAICAIHLGLFLRALHSDVCRRRKKAVFDDRIFLAHHRASYAATACAPEENEAKSPHEHSRMSRLRTAGTQSFQAAGRKGKSHIFRFVENFLSRSGSGVLRFLLQIRAIAVSIYEAYEFLAL